MDIETITKLIDAGYTKEEIAKLEGGAGDQTGPSGGEDHAPAGEEQGASGSENAGKVEGSETMNAAIEALTKTVQGLENTVKAMQQNNVNSANSNTAHGTDKIKDAMDSFINAL